ncbi:hypothetical protein F4821DRAFT_225026 [Hypoxylon rubiginosum]|uniref:Uncharacterized protein n=1 Tax=Hypoxylon rubiginosum TaxID=110542 RepID=A0ACC0DIK9_9PEZI|nr:hypothetical protein F4821DRAFT_225026 [Hypoxylon rubiginosum]
MYSTPTSIKGISWLAYDVLISMYIDLLGVKLLFLIALALWHCFLSSYVHPSSVPQLAGRLQEFNIFWQLTFTS